MIPLSHFIVGDMELAYFRWDDSVNLEILPQGRTAGPQIGKRDPEPLIQVAFRGDPASGGFSAGHTQRGGPSLARLKYREQRIDSSPKRLVVTTVFDTGSTEFRHVLCHRRGDRALSVRTEVDHRDDEPVVLEMLSSFTWGGLSPQVVHRIRSTWSNEGRLVSERVEDLQLEPSWSYHGVRVERFGQVGSLPVRKFFPFVAVEDLDQAVVWAVQLACPSSWQLELFRRGEDLVLSGGLADFEFGHWTKSLGPGEGFVTPWARLTVAAGSLDSVSQRLLDPLQSQGAQNTQSPIPFVFNEFCSTWGHPSEGSCLAQAQVLKGRGLDYFVIDAGWYADPELGWELNQGDWDVARQLFPQGFRPVVEGIREAGLRPGLWFELETVGPHSRAYQRKEHLLRREGYPVTSGLRRFWDMVDPWVVQYLSEKVIGRLKAEGFEYLKVDYNESIGVGCDGAESLGEGLRKNVLATQAFLAQIRREVPGLVIENCASGGHRLESSMVALTDLSSFSDAHECPEIPVLAANLHRVVPPRKSQIWAVIRKDDSPQRVVYSMAATFLGAPCLSGEVEALSESQWGWIEAALAFHRRLGAILCDGTSSFFGPRQRSYCRLQGWQGVLRVGRPQQEAFAVVHTFGSNVPVTLEIALPWDASLVELYGLDVHGPDARVGIHGRRLQMHSLQTQSAVAIRVRRSTCTEP